VRQLQDAAIVSAPAGDLDTNGKSFGGEAGGH
jgi:hypothetical protein